MTGSSISELPVLLGAKPIRSHLDHALVRLGSDHTAPGSNERWENEYARGLSDQFVI
jgi:hypothetical protein